MNNKNVQQSHMNLLEVGFTQTQIERLSQFRSTYMEQEEQQVLIERRRLEFVRWLVATGRITDY
ncbi:MAG: hypothetical protein ACYDER_02150 [Ktedonobacteraceae bacterium]